MTSKKEVKMIKNLHIQNFKAIKDLAISDFGRINVFVGKNSCGKTSILDAIRLFCAPTFVSSILEVLMTKGIQITDVSVVPLLFHNLETKAEVMISGETETMTDRKLKIEVFPEPDYLISKLSDTSSKNEHMSQNRHDLLDPPEGSAIPMTIPTRENLLPFPPQADISGVRLSYSFKNQENGEPFANVLEFDRAFRVKPHPKANDMTGFINCRYHTPYIPIEVVLARKYSEAVVLKRTSEVIEILKEMEPGLHDLRLIAGDHIYYDIGLNSLLPLQSMGDGAVRILSMLLFLIESQNGAFLVDEIENGLYFSSMYELWKIMGAAANRLNTQIFAATHSLDCLRALIRASGEIKSLFEQEQAIRLYRIERDGEKHSAIGLSIDDAAIALEEGWEIR
jgi:predicted ATPase